MQCQHVSRHVYKQRRPKVFVEKVNRQKHWKQETDEWHDDGIIFMLQSQDWVRCQIAEVNSLAILENIWMLFTHQPAYVREEETTIDIMWIGIGVRKFMMYAKLVLFVIK